MSFLGVGGMAAREHRRASNRDHDARRRTEQTWRRWYTWRIWTDPVTGLRAQQLARQPLCERHKARGQDVAADTVNHRTAVSSGRTPAEQWALFIDPNNHESTCTGCHSREIQREERGRPRQALGADGWPIANDNE